MEGVYFFQVMLRYQVIQFRVNLHPAILQLILSHILLNLRVLETVAVYFFNVPLSLSSFLLIASDREKSIKHNLTKTS